MKRLARARDPGKGANAATDAFDISRTLPGFRTPELPDHDRMLALSLRHILGIELAQLLRRGRRDRQRGRRK
jgi:hypothetical protein